MKKILFATTNPAKIDRFFEKLDKEGINMLSLKDLKINLNVEETGKNAIENALIKARNYYKEANVITMAMDDTLYLENVPEEFQPGVNVRRINGKSLTDKEMIEYYSNLASKYGVEGKITARWVYGLAIIFDDKEFTYEWSKKDFYLVNKPSSKIKDGYPLNSISINKKLNKYFSEMDKDDKNIVKEDESEVINFIKEKVEKIFD